MPKISIIIPTYNRSSYLKQAIESILKQSISDFEIIITDNASTDDTELIVKNFFDKRIKYFKNVENCGVVRNHNLALEKCASDLIHIFSDDDLMIEGCLESKINILNEPQNKSVGLLHSDIVIINSDGTVKSHHHWAKDVGMLGISGLENRKQVLNYLYNEWNYISMPSVVIRKEILQTIGLLSLNMRLSCDWDFWLRIVKKYDFYFLNEKTIKYRVHADNLTKEASNYEIMKEIIQMKLNFHNLTSFPFFKFYFKIISKPQIQKYLKQS
jgi:glycosyltransferase involved in cell wall biosynthesis